MSMLSYLVRKLIIVRPQGLEQNLCPTQNGYCSTVLSICGALIRNLVGPIKNLLPVLICIWIVCYPVKTYSQIFCWAKDDSTIEETGGYQNIVTDTFGNVYAFG